MSLFKKYVVMPKLFNEYQLQLETLQQMVQYLLKIQKGDKSHFIFHINRFHIDNIQYRYTVDTEWDR